MKEIVKGLGALGQGIGSNVDGTIIILIAAILFLLLVFLALALRTTVYRNREHDRTAGLLRQVQVLERSMAELRHEFARSVNEFKVTAAAVRQEIASAQEDIRDTQQGHRRSDSRLGSSPTSMSRGTAVVAGVEDTGVERPPVLVPARSSGPSSSESTGTGVVGAQGETSEQRHAIVEGMYRTKKSFFGRLKELFVSRGGIDRGALESLEEVLISSDVGPRCAANLVDSVRVMLDQGAEVVTPQELTMLLKDVIRNTLIPVDEHHPLRTPNRSPMVVLVVGVNGVGKTTTVAKLAAAYKLSGKKVVVIAGDTFRAAAVQQLEAWGKRLGFSVVKGSDDAKPASVVFDGMVTAQQEGADVVLIDTAGRLHTKSNLMQELQGIQNMVRRHVADGPHETLLVVDGVSGQNALIQAKQFHEVVPLSAAVVTKLDGTPKGGIIVALAQELKLPVVYVGVGESAKDLVPFSVDGFIDGLFDGA